MSKLILLYEIVGPFPYVIIAFLTRGIFGLLLNYEIPSKVKYVFESKFNKYG